STTAESFGMIRASASSMVISGPPAAKQSSVSWAMKSDSLGLAARQLAMSDNEFGDRHGVVDIDDRQGPIGQSFVPQHVNDLRIARIEQGLAGLATMDLDLVVLLALEALDDQQIDRRHVLHQLGGARLSRTTQLMHQCPAIGRGDQHFRCARRAMAPGILAR